MFCRLFQELEQRRAITNVNQRGCRPRGAPVTGKQCLTNIIFGRPLQRQNSFHNCSFGEDRDILLLVRRTTCMPSSRRSQHRLNDHSTGSLFNLIPLLLLLVREEKWLRGLYIRPSILYFKRQKFSSLQLHAMHFRKGGGASCACKVFKSGLKSGLKCLLQQAVIYLEFLGPFLLRKQHWEKKAEINRQK